MKMRSAAIAPPSARKSGRNGIHPKRKNGRISTDVSAPRNAEQARLDSVRLNGSEWKKWGPYLSERQWGTVREDYSTDGNAWDYFSHDQARSRAYRHGEDGLAGFSDDKQ